MLDVDSTLIDQEVIDELAKIAGLGEQVSEITSRAMAGELDFENALRQRVRLLKGHSKEMLTQVRAKITLTHGAEELISTLHSLGVKVGIVSGGFEEVIAPLAGELKLDFFRANRLAIDNGVITGEVSGRIIGRHEKAEALRDFAKDSGVDISQTVAVGDGANDIEMIKSAGLGIAFCAKAVLRSEASVAIDVRDLRQVLDYFI
ncbi:MAG: phosphoserine phosphatase SerB [Actinobacteria bacterium]|nr:phosphoserine phosphatase SerB [Actinomycetota bacterium]